MGRRRTLTNFFVMNNRKTRYDTSAMTCRRIYLPPNGGDNWCQRDIFAAYRKCLIDSCKSLAGGGFAHFKVVIWLISPLRKIPHARRRPLLQVLLKSLQSNFHRWCACTRVLIRSRPPLPSLARLREKTPSRHRVRGFADTNSATCF